jgi:outer membrane protein W
MRGWPRTVLLIVVLVSIATPALAEKGDSKLRFGFQWVSPTGDYQESEPDGTVTVEAESAIGGFVGYEYLLSDLLGLEASLGFHGHDIEVSYAATGGGGGSYTLGDIFVTPLLLGVNFHVLRSETVDLYVGLDGGYVFLSDVSTERGSDIDIKSSAAFGLVAGVDVPFGGGRWMFSGALQYLSYGAEVEDEDVTIDIDPLVVKVGVGVKF